MKALFGGALHGSSPVRFIYTDEAGTTPQDPYLVVVGVVLHADTQWIATANHIQALVAAHVPEHYREGFVFHASDIWNSKAYRDGWSPESRKEFLLRMMAIPRLLRLTLALTYENRNHPVVETDIPPELQHLNKEELRHARVFTLCMVAADAYIRRHAEPTEVATVVAEDLPSMRKALRSAVNYIRDTRDASFVTALHVRTGDGEAAKQVSYPEKQRRIDIRRIVDQIHFVEKAGAPILQVADACAFGLRRFFSKGSTGEEFASMIVGPTRLAEMKEHESGFATGYCTYDINPDHGDVDL